MDRDSNSSDKFFSADEASDISLQSSDLSTAPTELARQSSNEVATRILNRVVALMQREDLIKSICNDVLNEIIDKIVDTSDPRIIPAYVDRDRPAYASGQPKASEVVKGFVRQLRVDAPEFKPSPTLRASAQEFYPADQVAFETAGWVIS